MVYKIELKHIQYTISPSSDNFKLSKKQTKENAFDILIVSGCGKH